MKLLHQDFPAIWGSIEVGKKADFVVLDEDCNVLKTFVRGRECRRCGRRRELEK